MNPHDVLGVPKTASLAQIKTAYRRRAMQTHPDRGTDGAEFAQVAGAYAVLSDPARRKRFDETGSVDNAATMTLHQTMISILATMLQQTFAEVAKSGTDTRTVNYVEHMRRNVQANLVACKKMLASQRKMAADITIMLKRITRKDDGENLFVTILKKKLADLERPLRENEINAQALERLDEELSHYHNEVEVMQAFSVMQYGPGSFTASSTNDRNSVFVWGSR